MRLIFGLFFTLITISVQSQIIRRDTKDPLYTVDTASFNKSTKVKLNGKTHYTDYKIISVKNDTTIIDTTLTIKKDYLLNFLRKDNFELMPFHNQGQTFSKLAYQFKNLSLTPFLGANAKHFNYYTINDIYYYHVPTPVSEAMYFAGLEQGQVLDFLVAINTSPQFNFSLAYKGLRSLGKYRNSLSSHGNFRFSSIYTSKKRHYKAKFHYYLYDLMNEENGGITEESKTFFEQNIDNYKNRGNLDVNFIDANSMLKGNRVFLDHSYSFFKEIPKKKKSAKKDSLALKSKKLPSKKNSKKETKNTITSAKDSISKKTEKNSKSEFWKKLDKFNISVGHTFLYEKKQYRFEQATGNSYFGEYIKNNINDKATYNKMTNKLYVVSQLPFIGKIEGFTQFLNYKYFFNGIFHINNTIIPNQLKGDAFLIGGKWHTRYKNIKLQTEISRIIGGSITGNHFKVLAQYKNPSLFDVTGYLELTNKTADFNKLLYQSTYTKYNWNNNFKNESFKTIGGNITSKWGTVQLDYSLIHNYTYFDTNSLPKQTGSPVSLLKLKTSNEIKWGKFGLVNTVLYQEVTSGNDIFRVPRLLTRNTLYFQDDIFEGDPLFLQVGITFRYFTKYKMNAFNPLINEFYLQNNQEIGDYPVFDLFVNGRVRNVRLFLKVENFTSSFTGRKYYSAPYQPYRDLVVRFGLVWNWFM